MALPEGFTIINPPKDSGQGVELPEGFQLITQAPAQADVQSPPTATGFSTFKIGGAKVTLNPDFADLVMQANADKIAAGEGPIKGIFSTHRTIEQQIPIHAEAQVKGTVAAKPGYSLHERGMAFDNKDYAEDAPYLARYGIVNDIKGDPSHFHLKGTVVTDPKQGAQDIWNIYNQGEIRNPTTAETINRYRRKIADYLEPSAGVAGVLAGQVASIPAGGPANPAVSVPASALGTMLTKSIVDAIRGQDNIQADRIMKGLSREPTVYEQAQNVASSANEGLIASLLPEVISKGLGLLKPKPLPTPSETAGQILDDAMQGVNQNPYAGNLAEARRLQQEIPGWTATPGEAADNAALIKLQKEGAATVGAGAQQEHIAANNMAVRNYLESKIPGYAAVDAGGEAPPVLVGKNNAGTVGQELAAKQTLLGAEEGAASKSLFDELSKFKPTDTQGTGKVLEKVLTDSESAAWKGVRAKYQALGNDPVKVPQLSSNLDRLEAELTPAEKDIFPNSEVSRIRQMLPGPEDAAPMVDPSTGITVLKAAPDTVPFQDLVDMDQMVNRSLRRAPSGGPLERNLKIIKGTIEDAMEADKGNNPLYREAKKEAVRYYDTFDTGEVRQSLLPGNQLRNVSGKRMSLSYDELGDRFWSPHGADDLTRAIGKDAAAPIMENHAVHTLEIRGVIDRTTGEINQRAYVRWMLENKETLQKYGLWDKFNTVENAGAAFDAAKARADLFNKSAASKFLGADTDQALAKALSGPNPEAAMKELLVTVQGNPDAVQGLKVAFKDMVVGQAELHSKDIMQNQLLGIPKLENALSKYDGAMRILFEDEPSKIKALQNVRQAVDTTLRAQRPLVGGSPDTAPLLLGKSDIAAQVAGKLALNTLARRIPGLRTIVDGFSELASAGAKAREQAVWRVLNQSLYDPELADMIMTDAKMMGKSRETALTRQARIRMSPSVIAGTKDATEYKFSTPPSPADEIKRQIIMQNVLGMIGR